MNKIYPDLPMIEDSWIVSAADQPSKGKLLPDLLRLPRWGNMLEVPNDSELAILGNTGVLPFVRRHGPLRFGSGDGWATIPPPPFPEGHVSNAGIQPPSASVRREPISSYLFLAEYCRCAVRLRACLDSRRVGDDVIQAIQQNHWRRAFMPIYQGHPPRKPEKWSRRIQSIIEAELRDLANWLIFWSDLMPTTRVLPGSSVLVLELGTFYGAAPTPAQKLVLELFAALQANRAFVCSGCGQTYEPKRKRTFDGHGFHFCADCRANGRKRAILQSAQRQRQRA